MDAIYFNHIENHNLLNEVQLKFKTEYNRTMWISSHTLYVAPIEIILDEKDSDEYLAPPMPPNSQYIANDLEKGGEDDDEESESTTKEELFAKYKYVLKGKNATFQYVPILKSITSLMQHPDIVDAYFKSIPNNFNSNGIRSFYNSQVFKRNYIDLCHLTINGLQLVFFIDGYSNTNPLADARRNYKVTGVYFRIGNLPKQYQSVDYFTQLAILVYDSQLKYYGYDKIFKCLIDDLVILETEGINVNYKGIILYLSILLLFDFNNYFDI
jgi:hypothetical protein